MEIVQNPIEKICIFHQITFTKFSKCSCTDKHDHTVTNREVIV